jgi:hypothetical protein
MSDETSPHVCRPEQTDEGTVTCPECLTVYVRDEDATADERSYADA